MTAPDAGPAEEGGLKIPEGMLLEIQGRRFRPSTQTTFEQDIYIMSMLKAAGLMKMAAGFDLEQRDVLDNIAQDIIITAFASGKLFDILAATMEEEGTPWSISESKKNAAFFAQLREKADKGKLHGSIVGILMGFFVSGVLSSKISVTSSSQSDSEGPASSSGPGLPLDPSGAPNITETGTPSSERSPGTT